MRLNRIVQLFLAPAKVVSDGSEELETIDHILGELPGMSEPNSFSELFLSETSG